MSLLIKTTKNKSRIISIDNIEYCWLVGPNKGSNVFVAQKEGIEGRIIEVHFKTDINSFWVEFPNVKDLNLKVLYPKDSETIIRQALQLGWHPDDKGKPLVYDFENNSLVKRK